MKKFILIFAIFPVLLPLTLFGHGDHKTHDHSSSVGGPLLGGYPWGIFATSETFDKRVTHFKNDQELALANKVFESLADFDAVSFPVFVEHKGYKPFGDGQSNGQANFAEWKEKDPPLLGLLKRSESKLEIVFHETILHNTSVLQVKYPDGTIQDFPLNSERKIKIDVDLNKLGWNSLNNGLPLFVKPKQWNHWFALKFQNPYIEVKTLADSIPASLWLSSGLSRENALQANANLSTPPLLQLQSKSKSSDYLIFTTDKVHSEYPNPTASDLVHKSSGGNWTFLLNPIQWEGPNKKTFKQLYSCFEGRSYWEESIRKSVSGTSWHHVGDPGEIILNSIQGENRGLITALAEDIHSPLGTPLAYGLNFVGYSEILKPGFAFISIRGKFHWHPVHTSEPICVEVWTPECEPTSTNSSGFNCKI